MKLIFIIKALENTRGGAERVFAEVASGLAYKEHKITVATFDAPETHSFYPLSPKIQRIYLPIGNPGSRSTVLEFVRRIFALRRVIKQEKPDVVVAFMHSTFVPVSIATIGINIPILASEHIVRDHYKDKPLEYLLLLLSGFKLSAITVLSEAVKSTYPSFLRKKMVAIPNPVNPAKHYADPIGVNGKPKTILNIGRYEPQKDQKTLIQAFARIATKYPDWRLKIFGSGSLLNELKEQIASLGLEKQIKLENPKPDIYVEYEQAQIFALSSRYESFGLATAEAMAHGLPAIGFKDCPGTNELIMDGVNGLLVGGEDRAASFANGLERLMADQNLRIGLGHEARKSIDRYGANHVLDLWEKLLKSLWQPISLTP